MNLTKRVNNNNNNNKIITITIIGTLTVVMSLPPCIVSIVILITIRHLNSHRASFLRVHFLADEKDYCSHDSDQHYTTDDDAGDPSPVAEIDTITLRIHAQQIVIYIIRINSVNIDIFRRVMSI